MTSPVLFELDHTVQRLQYYLQRKALKREEPSAENRRVASQKKKLKNQKNLKKKPAVLARAQARTAALEAAKPPVDKWIEIYTERYLRLKRQASKLGLDVRPYELPSTSKSP